MGNDWEISSAPDELFEKGKQAEKEKNWKSATHFFDEATNAYKKNLTLQSSTSRLKEEVVIYFLRSRINALLNLFRFEFEESDEFDVHKAIKKIEIYRKERRELLKQYPFLFRRYNSIERSFFNKLEENLSKSGLKEEASLIFYESQKLETEILYAKGKYFWREKKYYQFFKQLCKSGLRQIFYNFYLGYGVRVSNLVISALLIILVFGLLYSATDCICITKNDAGFNFAEGIFGSIMTFIGFDFDAVEPLGDLGRWLICLEGILGFITFGGIIAYIWRKLK